VKQRLAFLILVSLLTWAALAIPARYLWGEAALLLSAVALALCLLPTTATLAWGLAARHPTPEQQLLLVLGGTGIRMAVVLGVGLMLYLTVDFFRQTAFWLWLLVFYLLTLALEIALLLEKATRPGLPAAAEEHSLTKP
jgi:hypothetical protein